MSADRRGNRDDEFEFVPPEGGWGYAVCVGMTVCFVCAMGHQSSLGFIFQDFLDDHGGGSSTLASVMGTFAFIEAFAGITSNMLMKKLSLRAVGLIGTVAFCGGFFLGVFMQSSAHLVIAYGALQGCGLGVMIPVLFTAYNSYFKVNKILYMSLSRLAIGIMRMVYPLLLKLTMENYGFRGTLAILFAISLNTIPSMMAMHPVEWHMKKKLKKCELVSVQPMTSAVGNSNTKDDLNTRSNRNINDYHNNSKQSNENLQPLITNTEENEAETAKRYLHPATEDDRDNSTVDNAMKVGKESSALSNTANKKHATVTIRNVAANISEYGRKVISLMDLDLFKDPFYTNTAFGFALTLFADMMFFTLQPRLLHHYKFDSTEITNIIAMGGAMDTVGRLILAVISHFYKNISPRCVFFASSLLAIILRTIFLQFHTYLPILILTGMLASLRAMLFISYPLMLATRFPIERYAAAYSLAIFLYGIINATVGPLIGIIGDVTGSYALAFHLLSVCNVLCVAPWSVEFVIRYTRRKAQHTRRKTTMENTDLN